MPDHIIARSLSKSFSLLNGHSLSVLENLSFTVGTGEIVGILGPSGCGKSTILNIVAGLSSFSGTLSISKRLGLPKIGYVFQSPRLAPWLTVQQNVELVMRPAGTLGSGPSLTYLEQVGLGSAGALFPDELSEGMKARVGIARALSINPNILLCDEPFSSLDEITAMRLREEIQIIWSRRKLSILFVTHNVDEAAFLCDRILLLKSRPAKVTREFCIDLPRPRVIRSKQLLAYVDRIYDSL